MPLRVSVELDRGNGLLETLAVIYIENVGGTLRLGDYVVRTVQGHKPKKPYGKVLGHRRLMEPVWVLVAKALKSLGYEAGPSVKP